MRRNLIYRKRRPIASILEFGLPLLALGLLLMIKKLVENTAGFKPTIVEPEFTFNLDVVKPFSFLDVVSSLQAEHKCTANRTVLFRNGFDISNIDFNWAVPFFKCDPTNCREHGEDALKYCEYNILALAPMDAGEDSVAYKQMNDFVAFVEEKYPHVTNSEDLPYDYPFLQTFSSNDALEDYVTSNDYGTLEQPKVGVAVVFSSITEKEYEYSIRVNMTNYNNINEGDRPTAVTTPTTNRVFDSFAKEDNVCVDEQGGAPFIGLNQDSCTYQYIYNGALTVQRLVDDWILDHTKATDEGYRVAENGVSFAPFPTREYLDDGFYAAIGGFAPLILVLGFLYPVSVMIRSITLEKELRQKELMKMMSVPESAIGWSWFVSFFFCFHFFTAIVAAIISDALYANSQLPLLFFFWEFAMIGIIVFCFVIAALFARSTRGVLVGLLLFFAGYFLTLAADYKTSDAGRVGLVALHPVTALSYGLQVIGDLEDAGVGVTSDTFNFSEYQSGYAFSDVFGSLIFDSVFWGVISWYLNRVVKGDFGQSLPWYFPFTASYWCPGSSKPVSSEDDAAKTEEGSSIPIESVSDALKEQEKDGKSVEVRNLSKHFGTKVAVDGLNLSMYRGQVTALLGHNGAGKTTTISMLTGMLAPTSGYAMISGKDTRSQLSQIREEVGICLQHDCLFPHLTVEEHLRFFSRIKGLYQKTSKAEAEAAIMTAIEDVALLEKRNTFSKNLSGGMKRKLSVAIAFCGDPKVVFLDEPTSGMDPFSRRFTWNVIRQYRQDRVIVLTTHFMDEADLLGDRIAIMAEGQLRCCGSPLFLKRSFGVGYQLTIEKLPEEKNSKEDVDSNLQDIVQGAVREATLLSDVGTEMSFQLPIGSSENFVSMFEGLDGEVEQGNIVTYGVGITTLDEVFLMVARGQTGDKTTMASSQRPTSNDAAALAGNDDTSKSYKSGDDLSGSVLFSRHVRALFAKRAMNFKRDKKAWCCSTVVPSFFTLVGFLLVKLTTQARNMDALTLSLSEQNPNIDDPLRNPIPFNDEGPYTCLPGRCISFSFFDTDPSDDYFVCGESASFGFENEEDTSLYSGPSCLITESQGIVSQVTEEGAFSVPEDVPNIYEASRDLHDETENPQGSGATRYGAIYFTHDAFSTTTDGANYSEQAIAACLENTAGVDYMTEEQCDYFDGIGYTVAYNFTSLHSSVLYQSIADTAIIREALGDTGYKITPTIHPLPLTTAEENYAQAEDSFTAWFLLVLSFPFITGAFGTFVVAERASKAKHLQTVAGVSPSAYWVSSYFWDIMNYQIPMWIVVMLMFAFSFESFTTTNRGILGGALVTLLLFGPASAGFTYCVSFAFESASYCALFLIVFNFFIGLAGPLVSIILRVIALDCSTPDCSTTDNIFVDWASGIEWILRFIPSFNLGKALLFIINIDLFVFIHNDKDMTVWSRHVLLIEVLYLAIQSVVYLALAIVIDRLSTKPSAVRAWKTFTKIVTCRFCALCDSSKEKAEAATSDIVDDQDVVNETERVLAGEANDDLIVLNELTKQYPNGKVAVNHMSLGIPHGQCFGLLGINGAGKTTTMQMLTAEFPPTSGDATLVGFSVLREPEQTRRRIGYCPQFDAHFANMTGREHVELYASIKGVSSEYVREAAAAKLAEVGLNEFDSDRLSSGYSGGMKRKLSVACATIGSPQIVFLDEPSTGMDPVARRDLWKVISDMVAGDDSTDLLEKPSVILTTHSMEECEALCPRIGIMAGGKLRCLGSAQHLKTRFGKGFQVEMKVKEVNEKDDDYIDVLSNLPTNAGMEESTFLGYDQTLAALQELTGDEYLSSMITPTNPTGYIAYKNAISETGISVADLAAFSAGELRVKAVIDFFAEKYEGSVLRERQDNKVRYEVVSPGLKISSLFGDIEGNKERLKVAEYGVSQTSLEQIFNTFAAEAEARKHNTAD